MKVVFQKHDYCLGIHKSQILRTNMQLFVLEKFRMKLKVLF